MADSHILGKTGEDKAAEFLKSKGYTILHRNWKSGKHEIDLVIENSDNIVFVEVKTRSVDYQMHKEDLVSREKQRSMIYAADGYIKRYNINKESRFDAVIIISDGKSEKIEHIEPAFYPTLR